jgi:hypothetical protein
MLATTTRKIIIVIKLQHRDGDRAKKIQTLHIEFINGTLRA